jgi:ribonuclease HI
MDKGHVELYTDGSSLGNPGPSGYGFVLRYWEPVPSDDECTPLQLILKKAGKIPNNDYLPDIKELEVSRGFRLSTNNRMELMACITGIICVIENINDHDRILRNINQINLTTDSKYFCDAINKGWIKQWKQNHWISSNKTPVKNRDLWEQIDDIQQVLQELHIILKVNHVLGHNGHKFNERADKLCTAASRDIKNHLIDEIYENSMSNKNTR